MMTSDSPINVVLLGVPAILMLIGVATWVSPKALWWLCVRLNARAHALTESRVVYRREYAKAMESVYPS